MGGVNQWNTIYLAHKEMLHFVVRGRAHPVRLVDKVNAIGHDEDDKGKAHDHEHDRDLPLLSHFLCRLARGRLPAGGRVCCNKICFTTFNNIIHTLLQLLTLVSENKLVCNNKLVSNNTPWYL